MSEYSIYISNKTKIVTNIELQCIATACNAMLPIVCKHWNVYCPTVYIFPTCKKTQQYRLFNLVDNDPMINNSDIHNEVNIPVKAITDNGGTVLYTNDKTPTIASFIFREISESIIDNTCNLWWIDPQSNSQNPTLYAGNICDPVQNDIVKLTVGIAGSNNNGTVVGLCNFILPTWKDRSSTSQQYDYLNLLSSPFSMNNGGIIVKYVSHNGVVQIFDTNVPNWLQNIKKNSARFLCRKTFSM